MRLWRLVHRTRLVPAVMSAPVIRKTFLSHPQKPAFPPEVNLLFRVRTEQETLKVEMLPLFNRHHGVPQFLEGGRSPSLKPPH